MSEDDQQSRQALQLSCRVADEMSELRLDQAVAQLFPQYSRARLSQWIKSGELLLDGQLKRPRDRVYGGEQVTLRAQLDNDEVTDQAEAIELDIVFEDEELLVINKPANLVVHPGAGNPAGTLLNALLYHHPGLSSVPRAGIVHRLDKNTTGLMVVAKTLSAHHSLVAAMQERLIKREYEAIVHGVMTAGGRIDAPIGRHPVDRKRMAVVDKGKAAITHYRVKHRFRAHTWVRVQLETGRTHQIRVHMAHRRYPIVGDPVYAGRARIPAHASASFQAILQQFPRQALHAIQLSLTHPLSGEAMQWTTELPQDMQDLISAMEQDEQEHQSS